ncbi:Hypothetical predicted protein [Mytilus galloprovincialis]|uniref:Uncharacterized protein n=1 Tax=Mytilus galloprovincialis TaxID=29158 RepID=A0A8B6HIU3_MYTGA|nr:Hypothetical predicted protein [Mytilus galloprovincialis]
MEYEGYVMSGYWGQRASSYICVDAHPDYVPGGKANTDGQLLYVTDTKCGTPTCPPYHDNVAVNCVFLLCFSNGRGEDNVENTDGNNKRLLLNDPDAINNRLEHLERSLQQQQATILQLTRNMPLNQGSNYIQWGKLICSAAETVYSGFATGQRYDTTKYTDRFGGPANFLCLPNNPELSNRTIPGNSFIYGTEYEENFLHSDSDSEDVPCAFCRSNGSASTAMFPGRKTCYDGWKMEYLGYIMSGYFGYRASSYICVDIDGEYVQGGKPDIDGQALYATGTKCGTLPCPPYNDNMAVYCVVCSK